MRLLDSGSLRLREFFDQDIPPYAIISHRWTNEEITYEDFLEIGSNSFSERKTYHGWTKIENACEIAQGEGIAWIWIDTICIDKKSSAELSEAINSMFKWYAKAKECWVFLPDVHYVQPSRAPNAATDLQNAMLWSMVEDPSLLDPFSPAEFVSSEWFTRAWTLQEMLAPRQVFFFNTRFKCIGFRESMRTWIGKASNIPEKYICSPSASVFEACVAERMKWASQRTATREEDIAYSLLGLFDVNMPLLYGEGRKAFRRLQTEIIQNTTDESIFAWTCEDTGEPRGLLAPDVTAFTESLYTQSYFARQHYEVTNKGIRLTLSITQCDLVQVLGSRWSAAILVPLNCGLTHLEARGSNIQNVVCLRVLVNDDPMWANSMEPVSRHLNYLLGSRLSLEVIQIPKKHRSRIPKSLYEFVRSKDGPPKLAQDLIAGLESANETQIDIPVYIWGGSIITY